MNKIRFYIILAILVLGLVILWNAANIIEAMTHLGIPPLSR
ncbi:hypothetical protein [Mammaliicoccus sciuri]|nr:hypothetical protein [Mammaliicoccus sciuri]